MKIEFYTNLIINSGYADVFDMFSEVGRTQFENYLAQHSLGFIEQDDFYVQNNGRFNLDYSVLTSTLSIEDINSFSYMKITTGTPNRIRYYFIQSAEYWNGIITVDYVIDIWHTYSNSFTFENAMVSKKRYDIPDFAYPSFSLIASHIPYNRKYLSFYRSTNSNFFNIGKSPINNYNIYVMIQTYTLNDKDEITNRESLLTCACSTTSDGETIKLITKHNRDQVLDLISKITINQSQEHEQIQNNNKIYYDVTDIYVIPSTMDCEPTSLYLMSNGSDGIIIDGSKLAYHGALIYTTNYAKRETEYTKDYLTGDKNIIGMGMLNNIMDINGSDIGKWKIKTFVSITPFDFTYTLIMNNKTIELGSMLKVDPPFNTKDGSTMRLQKISKINDTINGALSIAIGSGQIAGDLMTFGAGTGIGASYDISRRALLGSYTTSNIPGNQRGLYIDPMDYERAMTQQNNLIQSSNLIGGALTGIGNITRGIEQIVLANAQAYTSNTPKQTNNGLSAVFEGIIVLYKTPDNETQLTETIDNYGYNVSYIDNFKSIFKVESELTYKNDFDFIQCKPLHIKTNLPENIVSAIISILEQGIRIHYKNAGI